MCTIIASFIVVYIYSIPRNIFKIFIPTIDGLRDAFWRRRGLVSEHIEHTDVSPIIEHANPSESLMTVSPYVNIISSRNLASNRKLHCRVN